MIVGVTGGMGCGKSTAAKGFESHGFRRVDADAQIRELILTAPAVLAELRGRYGAAVFTVDGEIDRTALAALVGAADASVIICGMAALVGDATRSGLGL